MRTTFTQMIAATALVLAALTTGANAQEIGRIGVDWIGNDIVIDAVQDPKIEGVTCHIAFFDRSIIDRLQQGNWFEDPSNSSIDCAQTGALVIGDIEFGKQGEEVFRERRSIILKTLLIKRIYDAENNALVYLAHSRQIQQGSAKTSISVVPLAGSDVVWTNGAPQQRVKPVH